MNLENQFYRQTVRIYNNQVDRIDDIAESHDAGIDVIYGVLTQQRHDTTKIYSLHEPAVHFTSKGKQHKKYEFGNYCSFAYTCLGGIIVVAMPFDSNPFYGHTRKPQLIQIEELAGLNRRYAIMDRDDKGLNQVGKTNVLMPKNLKRESRYLKKNRKERCRSRYGIEGLISYLKLDHRMLQNYLKRPPEDKTNTFLSDAAYNMKNWMAIRKAEFFVFVRFLFSLVKIWLRSLLKPWEHEKQGIYMDQVINCFQCNNWDNP